MKILGIDYGEKRIGLAISDESFTLARELEIVSPQEFWHKIGGILEKHEVQKIVLGWPFSMDGKETKKTVEVKEFKQKLEKKLGLFVEIQDERMSTIMAHNLPGGRHNVDSLAAQIILQNFLNKNINKII